MTPKYKCFDCGREFETEKLFPSCEFCGWKYLKWTNFEELKEKWKSKKEEINENRL